MKSVYRLGVLLSYIDVAEVYGNCDINMELILSCTFPWKRDLRNNRTIYHYKTIILGHVIRKHCSYLLAYLSGFVNFVVIGKFKTYPLMPGCWICIGLDFANTLILIVCKIHMYLCYSNLVEKSLNIWWFKMKEPEWDLKYFHKFFVCSVTQYEL